MKSLEMILVLISLIFHLSKCQTITISTESTDDGYLLASQGSVGWGTPTQSSFKVLIDTTDETSWIYNKSASTNEDTFNPGQSSTFSLSTGGEDYYYLDANVTLSFATDTLTIGGAKLTNQV